MRPLHAVRHWAWFLAHLIDPKTEHARCPAKITFVDGYDV